MPNQAVSSGQAISSGPFSLEFFGGEHAIIHESFPVISNLGVMINETLYYPGDSFTNAHRDVKVLALPVSAPWLKIAEVINFITDIQAKKVFPTHDAILSTTGKALIDRILPSFVEKSGGSYQRLTDSIEIDE